MSDPIKLPSGARELERAYPEVWARFAALGKSVADAGPLDARSRRLVKLGLAVASRSEGAVHSHARRALAEGMTPQELEHVVLLSIPTIGLPNAVAALTWIQDITAADRSG